MAQTADDKPPFQYTIEQVQFPVGASRGWVRVPVHSFRWADGAETRCGHGQDSAGWLCYHTPGDWHSETDCKHLRALRARFAAF